jgi:hypothetical protein
VVVEEPLLVQLMDHLCSVRKVFYGEDVSMNYLGSTEWMRNLAALYGISKDATNTYNSTCENERASMELFTPLQGDVVGLPQAPISDHTGRFVGVPITFDLVSNYASSLHKISARNTASKVPGTPRDVSAKE